MCKRHLKRLRKSFDITLFTRMNLRVHNFKCFTGREVELRRLTVLVGANGNGKSTVIQALLLLRQTVEQIGKLKISSGSYEVDPQENLSIGEGIDANVPLNGKYCLALGTSSHVLNRNPNGPIKIGFGTEKTGFDFTYQTDEFEPRLWIRLSNIFQKDKIDSAVLKREFYYLNAERVGPRFSQRIKHLDFPHAGWQGEYTAQLMDRDKGYWKVQDARKFHIMASSYLAEQVNAWLGFIIPGTRALARVDSETLTAQVLLENMYTASEPTIATNLGFGITYVLPIVVTGLVAEEGACLIVENPEAHLHPAAQSRIGQFLAMLSGTGLRVVVETHSDHILNGIQIAVAKRVVSPENAVVNFFSHEGKEAQPIVEPIFLTEGGELTSWPKGFFDQTQADYANLIKLRKK
jgi:predicted ATPase